ncbi:MAG: NAD-glutamate dehydrogenase [Pseudomonadota bacterium]
MPRYKRRLSDRQDELLDGIYNTARTTGKLKDRRQLKRFLCEYYRNISEDDVREHSPATLASAALAHLAHGFRVHDGEHRLRIYNPTMAEHGWQSSRTVVELVHENMPFLVDSVGMTLDRLGYAIELTVHPLLRCERTAKGQFRRIHARDAATGRIESFIRMEIRRETRPDRIDALSAAIEDTLRDVRAAVRDWEPMQTRMAQAIDRLAADADAQDPARQESIALLRWLADDRFTFLGFHEYKLDRRSKAPTLRPVKGSGLGVNRHGLLKGHTTKLSPAMQRFQRAQDVLLITKANTRSTVHRNSYLDYIGVKRFDKHGVVSGEQRFVGLFTSQAYSEQPANIPLIRRKIDDILQRAGVDHSGHRGKALIHILNNYPRDELFQASTSDLLRTATGILNLQDRRRVKLFMRRDTFRRFYSCIVFIPRDKYSTEVRNRTEAILGNALDATNIESTVQLSDSMLARVHLLVYVDRTHTGKVSIRKIESQISDAVVTWTDRLRDALHVYAGEQRGADLFEQYARAFPLAYEEDVDAVRACKDIDEVDRQLSSEVADDADSDCQLIVSGEQSERLHFRVFRRDTPIALSDALPLLENLSARVFTERPYQLRLPTSRFWIQDFELDVGDAIDVKSLRRSAGEFARNFKDQQSGRAEADGYNKLIVTAGLSGRRVMLVRTYAKYLLQLGLPFSPSYLETLLCEHAPTLTAITDWFVARFDPRAKRRKRRTETLRDKVLASIRTASSLDADRALRALFNAVEATQRTNFFSAQTQHPHLAAIAIKISTRDVDEAPLPRPRFEIFVYSPRVEGVHLRAGEVARGGLRWSDRRDDFRTEVLGLMKAQTVKNTVIVPTGAKGGFYVKDLPDGDRDTVQREVTTCYKMFIRALLSVTDNIIDAKTVTPNDVVRLDAPDPYLVVAADKGTATFSDTANAIAVEQNFWLGDAFASGGSAGYDHKKMAITARGAWEAVKRHFREIGVDTQTDEFTVAGIGDMSGDVFGNGMLLSPTIRLQAAFNHQHIFLDPDPVAADSFAERQRLFALPRSGWSDYDTACLSAGGGVFSRSEKSIALSDEVRRMLDIDAQQLSPPQLISAILRMKVDLFWNGGIGTYVKASSESHNDVGDRHNDAVRINATDLRCKVIGEGGNLGLTQLARVEFDQQGGKINTDFIDNSAGVDSSDREVNIKILLSLVATRKGQRRAARDKLLASMTDEVAQLVLRNNYLQTQAISMMAARAVDRLSEHRALIGILERRGALDRALEFLPDDETLNERKRNGQGLTRPEIAVILSYAKLDLYEQLSQDTAQLNERELQELVAYFPVPLQKRYDALISEHPLGPAIVTTLLTNSLVNRMGPAFAIRAADDTGFGVSAIAASYVISRDLTGARQLWADIEKLDTRIPADIQYSMMFEIARKLRHACYWLLRARDGQLDIEHESQAFGKRVLEIFNNLPKFASKKGAHKLRMLQRDQERMGVPSRLAKRVAAIHYVTDVLEIVRLADERKCDTQLIAQVYFGVAERLSFEWLREAIDDLDVDGRWQSRARGTLRDSAIRAQRELAGRVHDLTRCRGGNESIDAMIAKDTHGFERLQTVMQEMRDNNERDFATLTVAVDELNKLAQASGDTGVR